MRPGRSRLLVELACRRRERRRAGTDTRDPSPCSRNRLKMQIDECEMGHAVSNRIVTRAIERAMDLSADGGRAHRPDEDRTEDDMDEESARSLTAKVANDDLVPVDQKLKRLHHDVPDEKGAQRVAARVPRHPVDDAKADEGRADVTRKDPGCDRSPEAESGQHRLGRDE